MNQLSYCCHETGWTVTLHTLLKRLFMIVLWHTVTVYALLETEAKYIYKQNHKANILSEEC